MYIYVVLKEKDISIKGYLNPVYLDDKEVIKDTIALDSENKTNSAMIDRFQGKLSWTVNMSPSC